MRGRFFNFRAIARAAGFAAFAVAVVVASVNLARRTPNTYKPTQWTAFHTDTFAETLSLCATLDNTATAENRKACEEVWAANRRRFFGRNPANTVTPARAGNRQSIANAGGR